MSRKVILDFCKKITAQFGLLGLGDERTHRTVQSLFPTSIADILEMDMPSKKNPAPHELADCWKQDKSLMIQAKVTEEGQLSSIDDRLKLIAKRISWKPEFNTKTSASTVGKYALEQWNNKVNGCNKIFEDTKIIALIWPKNLSFSGLAKNSRLNFTYFEHEIPTFEQSEITWKWGKKGKNGGVVWGYKDGENVFRNQTSGGQTSIRLKIPDNAIRFSIPYNPDLINLDLMKFDEDTIQYISDG